MSTIASLITSLTVVFSTVYSDADQSKHQSSASLAFVWGIHRERWIPRTKDQLRGKCFHLMTSSWSTRWNSIVIHDMTTRDANNLSWAKIWEFLCGNVMPLSQKLYLTLFALSTKGFCKCEIYSNFTSVPYGRQIRSRVIYDNDICIHFRAIGLRTTVE